MWKMYVSSEVSNLGLICLLSADIQEEEGIHQEQALPQEGQETEQEVFIESPPPTEAHCGRQRRNI